MVKLEKSEYLVISMPITARIIKDKLSKHFRNLIRPISMLSTISKTCKNTKSNLFFKKIYIVVTIKPLILINRTPSSKSKTKSLTLNINGIF